MNMTLLRAFGIPLVVFMLMQAGVVYVAGVMLKSTDAAHDPTATLLAMSLISYVLAGFLAGGLSPRRQISHGLVVGALCAMLAVVVFGASPGSVQGQLTLCAMGALLAALGALPSKLIRRGRVERS